MNMLGRRIGWVAIVCVAASLLASPAAAQYNDRDKGFFLFLDAIYATPRDTDDVVVTRQENIFGTGPQSTREITLDWDEEWAGAIEFGYRWANGSTIAARYWQYENDTRATGSGSGYYGYTNFAIGPSIYYDNFGYLGNGGYQGSWDIGGKMEAQTLDVMWGREHKFGDTWSVDWALGLRYANFEETLSGFYDAVAPDTIYYGYYAFGLYSYGAERHNKGEMLGLRATAGGEYSFSPYLSIQSNLGFSLLDGEVTGASSITPVGPCATGPTADCPQDFIGFDLPSSSFYRKDDDRSGSILDFDVRVVVKIIDDRYRFWLGYEFQRWEGLPDDLTRNGGTGNFVTLRRRNEVTFSGWKFGVGFLF
jgi:hypothetical protein